MAKKPTSRPPSPAHATPAHATPAHATKTAPAAGRWTSLWPYALLAAISLALYGNALINGFVSDDDFQLLRNPLVTDWHQLPQIFSHHIWSLAGQKTSNFYRPMQMVLYLLIYSLAGFNAFAFHLFQVLIHAVNAMLVYALAARILARMRESRDTALAAAILFAVYPIHSEAVVWIAVLPDVMMTLFALAAILLFASCNASPTARQIAALAGLFLLALLTKEPGAMLLPLLLGYEFLYLGRSLRDLWKNRALYASLLAVFIVYCVMRIYALGGMAPAQGTYHHLRGTEMILSVLALFGQYVAKLLWPVGLSYYYFFEPTAAITPLVIFALIAAVAMIAGVFLLRRRTPSISYALFLILIPLAPALNINGIGESAFAERYLYLPSAGAVLIAALGWQWIAVRQRQAAWGLLALVTVAAACIVIPRNPDWRDDERLFSVSHQQSPKAGSLVATLGWLHYQRGEYDQAIDNFHQAIQLQPDDPTFHNNISNSLAKKGLHEEAIAELRKAISLDPKYPQAHFNLGLELEATGLRAPAVAEYRIAVELDPNYAAAYNMLAIERLRDADYLTALDLLNRAMAGDPRHAETYVNLGILYTEQGQLNEAAAAYRKALEVDPNNAKAYLTHYGLGVTYINQGASDAAALEFKKSLELNPGYGPARDGLEKAQGTSRR